MKTRVLIAVAVVAAAAGCMGPGAGNGVAASDAGKPLRVAVFVGGGARNIGAFRWLELTARAKNVVATPVDGEAVRAGALDAADVLVMPGGSSVTEAKSLGASSLCKVLEVLHGPEFRVHIVVTTVLVTHGVRASRFKRITLLVNLGVERIVCALAVRDTNRVNRDKVNRIKAKPCNVVELLFAILPRRTLGRIRALALWPHFIPRTHAAVDRVHTELHHRAFGRNVLRFLGPCANLVFVITDVSHREGAFPEVVIHKVHRSLFPFFLGNVAVKNRGIVLFVAVAENVCLECHCVTGFTFEHEAAALDARADIFNNEIFF